MILLTAAMGKALMWLAGRLQVWTINHFAERGRLMPNISLASLAGLTESSPRSGVVLILSRAAVHYVNEPIDGMIYSSFAGLGAAIEESIWVLNLDHATHLSPQEPVRLRGTWSSAGSGATAWACSWREPHRGRCPSQSWRSPVAATIHTLWDVVAFDAAEKFNASRSIRWYHTTGGVTLMLLGMAIYRLLIADAARRTRLDDGGRTTLGVEHRQMRGPPDSALAFGIV